MTKHDVKNEDIAQHSPLRRRCLPALGPLQPQLPFAPDDQDADAIHQGDQQHLGERRVAQPECRMDGGIKANMIAGKAGLRIGFRPLPSQPLSDLHTGFARLLPECAVDYQVTFSGSPLPAGDTALAENRRLQARDFAEAQNLPIGNAVDFWTEAALFSEAGLCAIVFGPGDIAQAHSADEWVALSQLHSASTYYATILS